MKRALQARIPLAIKTILPCEWSHLGDVIPLTGEQVVHVDFLLHNATVLAVCHTIGGYHGEMYGLQRALNFPTVLPTHFFKCHTTPCMHDGRSESH